MANYFSCIRSIPLRFLSDMNCEENPKAISVKTAVNQGEDPFIILEVIKARAIMRNWWPDLINLYNIGSTTPSLPRSEFFYSWSSAAYKMTKVWKSIDKNSIAQVLSLFKAVLKDLKVSKDPHKNLSKMKVLKSLNSTLKNSNDESKQFALNFLTEIAEPVLIALQSCINNSKLNIFLNESISKLVVELIKTVNLTIENPRFSLFYLTHYPSIFFNISLPLLKCNQNDIEKFEENPEEFVLLSADLSEQQISGTPKSASAGLLKKLSQAVDGSLPFFLCFFESLMRSISENTELPLQYSVQFQAADFLETSQELKIETCLLSVCVVSDLVKKRPDLIRKVENLVRLVFRNLEVNGSRLVKNRLCMVFQYYFTEIFESDEEWFLKVLRLVIGFCNKDEVLGVSCQAAETAGAILKGGVFIRVHRCIPEIFIWVIWMVEWQESCYFFEIVQEIISINTALISPYIENLAEVLVNKVLNELKKEEKHRKSIIISKCWNILNQLSESENISKNLALAIEKKCWPLLENLEKNKTEFEEAVFFELNLMIKCEAVTEIGWVFLEIILRSTEEQETSSNLFAFFNCCLQFGKNSERILGFLKPISQVSMKWVQSSELKTVSNGCLILHQVLLSYQNLDFFCSVLFNSFQKLFSMKESFLKPRVLLTVLCCFFSSQLAVSALESHFLSSGETYLSYFLKELSQNRLFFSHPYDRKLGVTALVALLTQPNFDVFFVFPLIVDILTPCKTWDSQLDLDLDLLKFQNSFFSIDEYQLFNQQVRSIPCSTLSLLISRLTDYQKSKLAIILQSKLVSLGSNLAESQVRQILTPKRFLK